MHKHTTPAGGEQPGRLVPLNPTREREVIRCWLDLACGRDGERGGLPDKPDDIAAFKLLDAAGIAIERGHKQKGINILRLVVVDYRKSKEAAWDRRVLDRLSERAGPHER